MTTCCSEGLFESCLACEVADSAEGRDADLLKGMLSRWMTRAKLAECWTAIVVEFCIVQIRRSLPRRIRERRVVVVVDVFAEKAWLSEKEASRCR
jgi:hypothetical protein